MDETQNSVSNLIENQKRELNTKRSELEDALRDVCQQVGIWDKLSNAFDECQSVAIVNIFKAHSEYFTKYRMENEESDKLLESLYVESEAKTKEIVRKFVTLFPKACVEAGLIIDATSRHPKYSIKEFIRIEIDEKNLLAKVESRNGSSSTMPMDIDPLVDHIKSEVNRLFNSERKQDKVLSGMLKAYKAVCREEKRTFGDEIPLRRVINRFSKNWKQLKYDELNVDLGKLILSGNASMDGYQLKFNHTRDQRLGMLVFGMEKSGYIGYVSFKKETEK